jgi:hypothetical protein
VAVDNAAGTATEKILLGDIADLANDAAKLTQGTLPAGRLPAAAVQTSDSRLNDARTPTAHKATHAAGGTDALSPSDIGAAASSHTHTLSAVTDAGTAASKNAPASGNASSTQVVLGSDTRLTDTRTAVAHASSHQVGGSDAVATVPTLVALTVDQTALAVASADIVRLTSSAPILVHGLLSTGCPDGALKMIVNENPSGGSAITIKHESSTASAANRVRSYTGADVVLQPDGGYVTVHLSSPSGRWRA